MKNTDSLTYRLQGAITLCCIIFFLLPVQPASAEYRFERMWPMLQQPWYFTGGGSIAASTSEKVFVADKMNHRIQVFNLAGQFITQWGGHGSGEGQFDYPSGISIDNSSGNVYVVDRGNNRIQVFTSSGQYLMKWGSSGSESGQFDWFLAEHIGIAVDDVTRNVYVVDTGNNRVQVFDSSGQYVKEWGTFGTENGQFDDPIGIAIDNRRDYVYVTDQGNHRIQVFDLNGVYLRSWGSEGAGDYQFRYLVGIAVEDSTSGNIYVVESSYDNFQPESNRVKVYSPTGVFIRKWGFLGREDGEFYSPQDIAINDASGMVFVTDFSTRIQIFSLDGQFLTKWGTLGDDPGHFDRPRGIAIDDTSGKIFVVDAWNNRIQVFGSDGQFDFQWGEYKDPPADNYNLHHPRGITIDSGMVYIADAGNNDRIMVYDPNGVFVNSFGSDQINSPDSIAVYKNRIYVTDVGGNDSIRVFDLNGTLQATWTTYDNGSGPPVSFNTPCGIAIYDDLIYVCDWTLGGHSVLVLDLGGNYQFSWSEWDGGNERFSRPQGIAVDGTRGIVYVADSFNNRVLAFNLSGQYLETVGGVGSSEPGMIINPWGVALNTNGDVYISEEPGNNRVQVFKLVELLENAKAIIVAGGGPFPGNNLWDATQLSANFAYRTLTYRGFTKQTILYLTSDPDLDLDGNGLFDDVDGDATKENLESAINDPNGFASDADNLVLYLVDHGGNGTFRMSETEIFSATEFDSWLNQLQAKMSGRVIVVYDACESGSFLSALASDDSVNRIVVTSTSPGESANFVTQGSISFSNYFWTHIFNGLDMEAAVGLTREALGSALGAALQNPLVDADDNRGVPDPDLTALDEQYIGIGANIIGSAPKIGAISCTDCTGGIIPDGKASATLKTSGVTDDDGIARVWALIRPPDYRQGSSDNPLQELPSFELMPVDGDPGIYQGTYDHFNIHGTYQIVVYANDRIGNSSVPELISVSVENPLRRRAIVVAGGTRKMSSGPQPKKALSWCVMHSCTRDIPKRISTC